MTEYTAVIIKSGDWYAGTVKELTGVNTQGRTIKEVKENLKEAIQMIVQANMRHLHYWKTRWIKIPQGSTGIYRCERGII